MKKSPLCVATAIATAFALGALLAPAATAQSAPPAAPGHADDNGDAASTRVTVERDGNRTTVKQSDGCTTVKVCPGKAPARARQPRARRPQPRRDRHARAPQAVPPPPPAAPERDRSYPVPPPPSARTQACVPAPAAVKAPKEAEGGAAEQKHLYDPARTRLGIMSTAEVLGHGEWEIAGRNIVGMLELGVGLGDRFQLSAKTSPITWFVPGIEMGLKNALWMAEIKAQIWRSPKFKLAAELSYFHVANLHGVRPGLTMKIGGDHIAFHAGVGTQLLIFPAAQAEVGGPTYADCGVDGSTTTDCGGAEQGSGPGHDVHPVGYATAGLEVRFWRYGKFFVEGFVAGARGAPTVAGVVPGVRFHNGVFAADIGLGVLNIDKEVTVPLPVLNFSWRW